MILEETLQHNLEETRSGRDRLCGIVTQSSTGKAPEVYVAAIVPQRLST